jgi:hypothetical protein
MNMGLLFKVKGQNELARSKLLRSYQIYVSNFGELHPSTQKALSNLQVGWEEDSREYHRGEQHLLSKPIWKWRLKKLFS